MNKKKKRPTGFLKLEKALKKESSREKKSLVKNYEIKGCEMMQRGELYKAVMFNSERTSPVFKACISPSSVRVDRSLLP